MTRTPEWHARLPRWWNGWRGEALLAGLACIFVVIAFPAVIFDGRTFMTGWKAPGVDGFMATPPGFDIPDDGIRADAGASAWQFDPWAEVTSRAWRHGDIPLWNPDQGMGTPHAAAFQTAVFDPLLALVNIHPTPLVWDFSFLLAFCLGAAAMYLFLRQIGLGRLAAFVGTAPFIWSGFFFRYSNNHFFRSYLYLPVLLLLAHRTVRSRRYLAPCALGIAVAGNVLVGMPEPTMFVLGTLTLYCLFLLAFPPCPVDRWAALRRSVFAAAVGGALAAPLLLPGAEFIRLSFNTHDASAKLGMLADPPGHLLRWLMPYSLGEKYGPFAATRNWVGMASMLAAAGALAAPRTMRRHAGWFFFLLGAAILAKGYGFPAVRWAGRLPGLDRSIIPVYAMPIVAFCVAVLVGIGIQAIADADVRRRRFLVVAGVVAVAVAALMRADRDLMGALPPGHLARQLAVAGLAASAVVLAFLSGRRVSRGLVALAIVAELVVLIPRGIQGDRLDAFIRPPWLNYVTAQLHASPDRVFALDAKLFPNTASAFGLQDIRSLNAVYPDRYVTYVKQFIQPVFEDRFLGGPPFGSEPRRGETDGNPMFDLTGVRYIVAAGQQPGDLLVRDYFAAHPPTDAVRSASFELSGDRRSVMVVRAGSKATVSVPPGARTLLFSTAVKDPAPGVGTGGTGVRAVVRSAGPEAGTTLWSGVSAGDSPPADARWTDLAVEIPAGTTAIDLEARADRGAGGVGFANLQFAFGPAQPGPQYRRVAAFAGTEVFENTRRLPRAIVVNDVQSVDDEAGAVRYFESVSRRLPSGALRVVDFDPSRRAVVEGLPRPSAQRPAGCDGAPGRATIRTYDFDEVVVDVETTCPGLVMLSDIYYPGWTASVNGKAAPVRPTNIAFRGVEVGAGRSSVVFRYRPRTFRLGLAVAITAIIVAGLTAAGSWRGLSPLRRPHRSKPAV